MRTRGISINITSDDPSIMGSIEEFLISLRNNNPEAKIESHLFNNAKVCTEEYGHERQRDLY